MYALADKKALADCVKLVCQFYGFHGHKVERLWCDMTTLVGKDSGWKARMEESDVRAVCADLHLTLSQAGAEMQQQNPVERMIGTLGRDLSTVLLTQHMFAKKHWLLGYKYVATIRNCLPTEAHPLTSPMELVMLKVAPDFEHIAVAAFGQPVIVPRVGANGIGDTNWEPAAMVAPLLEGGKLHAVMFEGESKPTIRGGVKAVNRSHLELTAQDRKALETKYDDRGRVVEFHSAAKKDSAGGFPGAPRRAHTDGSGVGGAAADVRIGGSDPDAAGAAVLLQGRSACPADGRQPVAPPSLAERAAAGA